MSLIHWWPLNGDLKDYGTGNITLTNNGNAEISNNGKIGKTYNLTSGKYLNATTTEFSSKKNISVAYWVKLNENSSTAWLDIFNLGVFRAEIYNNNQMWTGYSDQVGSIAGTYVTLNTWIHYTHIYDADNHTYALYKNEILVSKRTTNDYDVTSGGILLGENALNVNLNDFRIYDHALSVKEVKELSKGLVLHYNFEDPYVEGTTNLHSYSGDVPHWSTGTFYNGATGVYGYGINSNCTYSFVNMPDKDGNTKKMVKVNTINDGVTAYPYIWIDYVNPPINEYTTISFDYFTTCATTAIYPYSFRNNYRCSYWDEVTKNWIGGNSTEVGIPITPNKWNHIVYRFTRVDDSYASGPGYVRVGTTNSNSDYWLFDNVQVERKDHPTPYVNGTREQGIIYDNSGYGNNSEMNGNCRLFSPSNNGNYCMLFKNGVTDYLSNSTFIWPKDKITISFWWKSSDTSPVGNYHIPISSIDYSRYEISISNSGYIRGGLYVNGIRRVANGTSAKLLDGNWHLCTMTYDGSVINRYVDAVQEASTSIAGTMDGAVGFIFGHYGNDTQYAIKNGYISDIKIYSTALNSDDIMLEYNRKASIDRNGNLFVGILEETSENLASLANYSIIKRLSFDGYLGYSSAKKVNYDANYPNPNKNGLGFYSQDNCQCSITEQGVRIYSTENASSSSTWGGLCFSPMKTSNCLIKGHRYVISWHVKGKTSRPMADVYWTNAIGWGQSPDASPTVNSQRLVPANFEGEMDCYYDFTITDDVFKTTGDTVHSGFEANTTYLAYAAFKIGFTYQATGALGTDIYITELQMRDITNDKNFKVTKQGMIVGTGFSETERGKARLFREGSIDVNEIHET